MSASTNSRSILYARLMVDQYRFMRLRLYDVPILRQDCERLIKTWSEILNSRIRKGLTRMRFEEGEIYFE